MKYQNFKGDFTVVESFTRDGAAVPVPDRVIVHYFTKKYAGRVVCERNGDSFQNCRLSNDGMSLICSVALSRQTIGMGLLCHNVIEVAEDENFPDSEQHLPIPEVVISDGENVMIYEGPSDNTNEIISAPNINFCNLHTMSSSFIYLCPQKMEELYEIQKTTPSSSVRCSRNFHFLLQQ